jgi:hypothetical protein
MADIFLRHPCGNRDCRPAIIVSAAGITGSGRFVLSFILYAALFFAVLYAIERIAGIRFFNLNRDT